MDRLFISALLLLISSYSYSQNFLYDKDGIRLSYTATVAKTTYCDKEKREVYFVKIKWTLNNSSGKTARISYALSMPAIAVTWCTPQGIYDEVMNTSYQPSGTGFGGAVLLKSGEKTFGENGGWYFNTKITPGWSISKIDFPKTTTSTFNLPNSSTVKPNVQTKPAYGISQQGDLINNPTPKVDYTKKQKEENKTADDNMKAWQNSYQDNQNQINTKNNMSNRQQQFKAQKLAQIQQNFIEQQRRYQQTEIELGNAKNVSINAYQQAINNGKKESGAMLDATLSGANQITDPNGSLIYTGVGLGISLWMHLFEKKAEKRETELAAEQAVKERNQEEEQKKLLIEAKGKYIREALDINKYTLTDLIVKARYATILLVPKSLNAEDQNIFFTYPIQIPQYSDDTYPLKPDIEKKMMDVLDKSIIKDKTLYTLYPVTNLEKFINDFVKKMGSGKVINLNADLLNFLKAPFADTNQQHNETDFWAN